MNKMAARKIYNRRKEAERLIEDIEYFDSRRFDALRINPNITNAKVTLSGEDNRGNTIQTSCYFFPGVFNKIRHEFVESMTYTKDKKKKQLEEIPDAKVITVDFHNKKTDPDQRPIPNRPPIHQNSIICYRGKMRRKGAHNIYRGAFNIAKAAGLDRSSQVKEYVKNNDFPAFKIQGKKHWYAFEDDIKIWKWKKERENSK